jgi:hypothetical protein
MFLGVGKADLGLAHDLAFLAAQARDLEGDKGWFASDGEGAENALRATGNPDVLGTALGAAEPLPRLVDAKGSRASLEMFADVMVANEAKGTYQ